MADLFTDLTLVKKGLATACLTIAGMHAQHWPVAQVNAPQCAPGPTQIDMDSAEANSATGVSIAWRCYAAAAGSDAYGYELMDKLMAPTGPSSIVAAILADKTLGGVCLTVRCERWTGPGIATVGAVEWIAAELTVAVF